MEITVASACSAREGVALVVGCKWHELATAVVGVAANRGGVVPHTFSVFGYLSSGVGGYGFVSGLSTSFDTVVFLSLF